MALATWWATDALSPVPPIPGFYVSTTIDAVALASLNGIAVADVAARRTAGHHAYVGFMDGTPVTYGWVATCGADIGELALRFDLPPGDRYLWDFATLPAWQGRGLYPRLLQAVLLHESRFATRFWIIHAPENLPSGNGMQKAGLTPVGRLSFDAGGRAALTPSGSIERAKVGARVLGVPLVSAALSPCWRCQAEVASGAGPASCSTDPSRETCACAIRPRPSRPTLQPVAVLVSEAFPVGVGLSQGEG